MEACDTTKPQSTFIAKQIAIQSAVKKATQLEFTSIIILTNTKGIEQRWKKISNTLSQQGMKLIVQVCSWPHLAGNHHEQDENQTLPYIIFGRTK